MTESPQGPLSPSPAPVAPAPAAPVGTGKNGIALAGMILGIISVATCWIWCFPWTATICGIMGLILSVLGKKKALETGVGAGQAKAGLICSIIGLAISVVPIIMIIAALISSGPTIMEEFRKATEEASRQIPNQQ